MAVLFKFYNVDSWLNLYYVITAVYVLLFLLAVIFKKSFDFIKLISVLYSILVLLLICWKPLGEFGFQDTSMYMRWFDVAKKEKILYPGKDIGFDILTLLSSFILNVRGYFIFIALLSGVLVYLIMKRLNSDFTFIFIAFYYSIFSSFVFNNVIIRQNLGFLFFMLAILQKKRWKILLLLIASVSMHKSMLLPTFIFIFVSCYSNLKLFIIIWLCSIPFLLLFSSDLYSLIGKWDFAGSGRLKYIYEDNEDSGYFSRKALHWKTIVGSFTIILYGCSIIVTDFKKNLYKYKILGLFILTNAVWVIFSMINYHNRIAYLSLFLVPLLLLFPFYNSKANVDTIRKIGLLVAGCFALQVCILLLK